MSVLDDILNHMYEYQCITSTEPTILDISYNLWLDLMHDVNVKKYISYPNPCYASQIRFAGMKVIIHYLDESNQLRVS